MAFRPTALLLVTQAVRQALDEGPHGQIAEPLLGDRVHAVVSACDLDTLLL